MSDKFGSGRGIPKLTDPDQGEVTDPEAAAAYKKLQSLCWEKLWTDDEIAFVNELRAIFRCGHPKGANTSLSGALVFTGGHVRISDDGGKYYVTWLTKSTLHGGKLRAGVRKGFMQGSSHKSDLEQYEVIIEGLGGILVGCSAFPGVDARPHTWFQSEAFPATPSAEDKMKHALTFVKHVGTGFKQVGGLGTSEYSEKKDNPVVTKVGDIK
jgi:hypothetical protein